MSKENKENQKDVENASNPISPQLPEGLESNNDLNLSELSSFSDETEAIENQELSGEEEEMEQISNEDLKKLLLFTTGEKNPSEARLDALKENEEELERLIRISMIKSQHFTYNPKKKFDAAYKQKRKRRNRMARASRRANR